MSLAAGVALTTLGGVLIVMNVLTVRALWLSPTFERPQKVAQTVFVWLVPGAFYVVRYFLREPTTTDDSDPTAGRGGGCSNTDADASLMSHGHDGAGGDH